MEPESSATNRFSLDGDRSSIVRADEKLAAFMELETAVHARGEFNMHSESRSG
jgi:hypothetical protein